MGRAKKEVTEEAVVKTVVMKVKDGTRLNLREEPSLDANVLEVLKPGVSLIVEKENSTKDFYCVKTSAGIKGYCKKEYLVK